MRMPDRRHPVVPPACLAGALLVIALSTHAAQVVDGVSVAPVSPAVGNWTHGYVLHRVQLSNQSDKDARRVRLSLPQHGYGGSRSWQITSLSKTVVLPPLASATVDLWQPPLDIQGNNQVGVQVNRGRVHGIHMPSRSSSLNMHNGSCNVLVSQRVPFDKLQDCMNRHVSTGHTSHSGGTAFLLRRAESDVNGWPRIWLAYSALDSVVISADDWERMPAGVRTALTKYMELGGSLVCISNEQRISPTDPAWQSNIFRRDAVNQLDMGFGRWLQITNPAPEKWPARTARTVWDAWKRARTPWEDIPDIGKAHKAFPVVEDIGVPVRGIFYVLLGFSILIGPIALVVLTKMKRKIWLLWVAPALSFTTCILVAVYAMVSEGVRPTVRSAAVTLLDQPRREALTLGMVGLYCPLTPGGGLHFQPLTEVTPLVSRANWGGSSSSCMIDLTDHQHFAAGWVKARVPSIFRMRKYEPRRERLDITRESPSSLHVVNGLGAPIEELLIRDGNGDLYLLANLAPGAAGTATRGDPPSPARQALSWTLHKNTWGKLAEGPPPPPDRSDSYVALLTATPFLEAPLSGRTKHTARAWVLGRLEPGALKAGSPKPGDDT